jgi:hypothetical protein
MAVVLESTILRGPKTSPTRRKSDKTGLDRGGFTTAFGESARLLLRRWLERDKL